MSSTFDDAESLLSLLTSATSPSVPTVLQRASDFASNAAEAGDPLPVHVLYSFDYSFVVWRSQHLAGYSKLLDPNVKLFGWWWREGVPLENGESGRRYWLCRRCHQQNAESGRRHHFAVENGSGAVIRHLANDHSIDEQGNLPRGRKRRKPSELEGFDPYDPHEQELLNELAGQFDSELFKRLLTRWVVCENIPFRKVDSQCFRDMMIYANSRCKEALPHSSTLREWVIQAYNLHKQTVINELRQAQGLIHLSFDLWTSRNLIALNGVVAHYYTANNDARTLLLALPEHDNEHSGVNIA